MSMSRRELNRLLVYGFGSALLAACGNEGSIIGDDPLRGAAATATRSKTMTASKTRTPSKTMTASRTLTPSKHVPAPAQRRRAEPSPPAEPSPLVKPLHPVSPPKRSKHWGLSISLIW